MTEVYGTATPGVPYSWQRDVWVALYRGAKIGGRGNGERREPPFRYGSLRVTAGRPRLPYGRSTHGRGHLTHIPHTVLFAWERGRLAGRMVAWYCGSRTAYFRFMDEPDSTLCVICAAYVSREAS